MKPHEIRKPYRGKTSEGEIVYGYYEYDHEKDSHLIYEWLIDTHIYHKVMPESLERYIITHIDNEHKLVMPIYEGDLLRVAGIGMLEAEYDSECCMFLFTLRIRGEGSVSYMYQDIIEDIESKIE